MLFIYGIASVMIMLCYDYEALEANEHKKNKLLLCPHTLQWPGTMKCRESVILNEQLFQNVIVSRGKNLIRYKQFFMETNNHFLCH